MHKLLSFRNVIPNEVKIPFAYYNITKLSWGGVKYNLKFHGNK